MIKPLIITRWWSLISNRWGVNSPPQGRAHGLWLFSSSIRIHLLWKPAATQVLFSTLALSVSQTRFLNWYKVTEPGCIIHIPPKLERVREIYFSFYHSSCIYSNHAIMLFGGGKALPEIKENTFIGKRGKALCLFYQNLLCSNYKV